MAAKSEQTFRQPEMRLGSATPAASLRILFVVRSLGALRYFQSTIELLVERGHKVKILVEKGGHGPAEQRWLDKILENPNVSCDVAERVRADPWQKRAVALRMGMEYVHFLGPEFESRPRYALKALRRSPPRAVRLLTELPMLRRPRSLRLLYRLLGLIERALPAPARAVGYFSKLDVDMLVVGDAGSRASLTTPFVREAKRRGIPTAVCVASWDNLTTRPRMRVAPDRLVVWNDVQREEAVAIHGIARERVVVTGAANFDQWFTWEPSPAEEFLARTGLDPDKPFILWVGSALNHWERPEVEFLDRWLRAVRSAPDPTLRGVGVLVRPHPLRLDKWRDADFAEFGNVVVWPPGDLAMPVDADQKSEYYDSIYHSSAVVGINTSAMIEAAIIGRPVLTVLAPEHHDSQYGALHFSYLLEAGGGGLRLAEKMEDHLDDLSSVLAGELEWTTAGFVTEFVRPCGLETAATPRVIDSLEELATSTHVATREPLWILPLRGLIVLAVAATVAVTSLSARRARLRRSAVKVRRRALKRLRRLLARFASRLRRLARLRSRVRRVARRARRF